MVYFFRFVRAYTLALLLEEKHNERPSTLKIGKFTETIDLLKSASAWDKFSLRRFGVDFKRMEHTPLASLIADPRYYDPETETTDDFAIRTICLKLLLMEEYVRIIKASEEVTEDDLRMARTDKAVKKKLRENHLLSFMLTLVDILETESEESRELEIGKGDTITTVTTTSGFNQIISPPQPITPPYSQARFPSSFETLDNKRKISETSFGTRSTESTPNKLVQAEAKFQSLQNILVETIIDRLWSGQIDIPWIQGRHMFLSYTESLP
jgi:hypothetical protein